MTDERDIRKQQETWLRLQGLALLIPGRRRIARIIASATPLLLCLSLIVAATTVIESALNVDNVDLEQIELNETQALMFLIGFGLLLVSIPAAIGYHFWQRRRRLITQLVGAAIIAFIWLGGLGLLGISLGSPEDGWQLKFSERLLVIAVTYLLVYWELPSIIRWAGTRVWRELPSLAPMIARVLPFLLLAQLLVFFTNEIWQLAYSLSSAKMWAVNGVLLLPVLILIGSATVDALRDQIDRDEPFRPELLVGTPFEGMPDATRGSKLRVGEAINLWLLPVVAQLIQVGMFVVLLCAFFLCFGAVALSPAVIAEWTNKPEVRMVWLGINLPIDRTMFRVSLILATFSGLSFAASNVTDENYRKIFLDPVIDEMQLNLAARHAYCTKA